MKYTILLLLLFISLNANSILITGHVTDAENNNPIEGVNVSLIRMDSTVIDQTVTQIDGEFILDVPHAGDYYLMLNYMGYASSVIAIANLQEKIDLGLIEMYVSNIELDEVMVSAQDYTKIDRQIIFPSKQVITHSFSGLEVLNRIMLPGLIVNTATNSVSLLGDKRPVQLRINEVIATMDEILALNPQCIVKIEYIDLSGVRYGDVGAVLNFILRKPEKGFSTGGNTNTAFNTAYTDNSVYFRHNYKLSEFALNYRYLYSDFSDRFTDERQFFQLPENTLELIKYGKKAPDKSIRHRVALSYQWNNNEGTFFNLSLRSDISRPDNSAIQMIFDDLNNVEYTSYLRSKDRNFTPSLDLYFQYKIDDTQTVVANAVGTYISTDYQRNYYEVDMDNQFKSDYSYDTDGKKYSLLSEVIYENKLNKAMILSTGIKYSQAYLENTYNQENEATVNSMNTSDMYGYIQLQGALNKFSYQIGVGYSRQYFHEDNESYTNYLFQPNISLMYSLKENLSFRYRFYLMPFLPGLSQLSDFKQWQNEYEVFVGNPGLKPFNSYTNMFSINYRKKNISFSPSFYYQYNPKSIMGIVERVEENGRYYFLYSDDNQKNYQHVQGSVYLTLHMLNDRLNITGFGVLNRYINKGNTYTQCYTDYFGGIRMEGYYKNLSISASYTTKSKMLVDETLMKYSPNTNLGTRYKYKNFQYGLEIVNLFLPDGNSTKQKFMSEYVQKESESYNRDYGNMVKFSIAWNLEFGRKYATGYKRLEKADYDAGIVK